MNTPVKRLALGLFHFNVHYVAGDSSISHRYCSQTVVPFLIFLKAHSQYRVTFEIAGHGLEFLDLHYPQAIGYLRDLCDLGQVELISSTYAPTAWIAFPLRDLMHSIRLNRQVLKRLSLKPADIFFAQECFFGFGLQAISDQFSIALCKDDYLRYVTGSADLRPIYRLGALRVIVGSNHIGNEAARRLAVGAIDQPSLSTFHRARIARSVDAIATSSPEVMSGSTPSVGWYWYHMGNGHHFTTWAQPTESSLFFYDQAWMAFNQKILDSIVHDNYSLSPIAALSDAVPESELRDLPPVVEGSWNAVKSNGVGKWMGSHTNKWENAPNLLGLAWRSRNAVRRCEEPPPGSDRTLCEPAQLDELWKLQILAEASDPLGWEPTRGEVQSGFAASERVLQRAAQLDPISVLLSDEVFRRGDEDGRSGDQRIAEMMLKSEAVGEGVKMAWTTISSTRSVCEVAFRTRGKKSGVRFQRSPDNIMYCPSGLETVPHPVNLSLLSPTEVYLPLSNGLISLTPTVHLIRVNHFGQTAARISSADEWVEFAVEGHKTGQMYKWQFVFFSGAIADAVDLAHRINVI